MSTPTQPTRRSPGGAARVFRWLLRALLVLALIALLAVGIYLGAPFVYRELVLPVRQNSAQLVAQQTQIAADRAAQTARLDDLQARLNALEATSASSNSDQAVFKSNLEALREDLNTAQQSLGVIDQTQNNLSALATQIDRVEMNFNALNSQMQEPDGVLLGTRRDLKQLTALNLLLRAQIHLDESNFGLAREDALLVRQSLVDLRSVTSDSVQIQMIDAWLARLDLALANLPGTPVVAASDLDQLYHLIIFDLLPPTGTPEENLVAGASFTPTPWLTGTAQALSATPTPTPWLTGTAQALTASPTPTPWLTGTAQALSATPTSRAGVTATPTP